MSRKARSRQVSGASSLAPSTASSRAASRNPSRQPSDDEEENLSDSTSFRYVLPLHLYGQTNNICVSVGSIDDILPLPSEDGELLPDAWIEYLRDRMEEIIDRKRSSVQGRETCLQTYNHVLMAHYARDEINPRMSELVGAFLKSVRSESSEKETVLALKGTSVSSVP